VAHCFVTRQLPGSALDRLREVHSVEVWEEQLPPSQDELRSHAASADGLITLLSDRIDAEFLDSCPQVRAIANYAVGYDNISLEATRARGIPVGNTPDVLTDATADLAFALLMAAARQLVPAAVSIAGGEWLTWETTTYLGAEVWGATLAIIGFGRIGQAMGRRGEGFNMKVVHAGAGDPLRPVLEQADFVSLHCPLTPETEHLIDAEALGWMKPSAILVNTARGPIVDTQALAAALAAGEIAGAALDVTDPEPLPADDPLLRTPGVLITPHIGSATRVARERMADLAVENLLAGLAGRPMPHQVS
jgi:glyoxylate reductase